MDYFFLLPVDEGVTIVQTTGLDVIALDGITDPNKVFTLNSTSAIKNLPNYVGAPFSLGRESTRIYVIGDSTITTTKTMDIKYVPQFLNI